MLPLQLHHRIILPVITCMLLLLLSKSAYGQEKKQMVCLAKLVIDQAQLEDYKSLLKEEIETSVRRAGSFDFICRY